MLQLELLSRIAYAGIESVPSTHLNSLRQLSELEWKDLFEAVNVVDRVLADDPAAAYLAMDYESRDLYRTVISELASRSPKSEREVAETAVLLARESRDHFGAATRPAERRAHVGFYLVDAGIKPLRELVGFKPTIRGRIEHLIRRYPEVFYLFGIEIMTFLIVYALLAGLDSLTPAFIGFFLLILPATQAAVDFMNNLVSYLLRPRALPKLDFSKAIPDRYATMVTVPTLLINEKQVCDLVTDLEIRFLANRDRNLYFALLTDTPDSSQAVDERDQLAAQCQQLVEGLNERYGSAEHTPFYLFHRHRVFNESEGSWMGWERKRGKLLDLNRVLRGGFDAFPVKVGNSSVYAKISYIITLDSDTQLPRDSARELIGAIAHPLNRAVVDPGTRMVVEGYGILQPRVGVSIQSAASSWLASIYSGQTGFDIYTRAVSDVYQDLFGEGMFTGKGIYEVDVLRVSLEQRFPENTLLSHDLIEGAYARAGLVSDIEVIDDYPSHFSAYSRRKHRWMRGDWQILRWLWGWVPDRDGQLVNNPITILSRWKILDNLRRSLFDPATLVLLLSGWFYLKGEPIFWTAASLAMLLMPAYSNLLFSVLRAPWGRATFEAWAKDTSDAFLREHIIVLLHLMYLLDEALLATDAIVRSVARVFITRRKLLEWETAAEAEQGLRKSTADRYLALSAWLAAAIGVAVYFFRIRALPVAAPILVLWMLAPAVTKWLNRKPAEPRRRLAAKDAQLLRFHALRMWRYFEEWSNARANWTIPDHVREDGIAAERLSPTNLGFLLNARVAALHFGYTTLPEFVDATLRTLEAVSRMPHFRGHVLNWYTTDTLQPLPPLFVSSVDSGNLAACLWTLKQAAIQLRNKQPGEEELWSGIRDLAEVIGSYGGEEAVIFRDLVLCRRPQWSQELPALEFATRQFATKAVGDPAAWAEKLLVRLEHIREWLDTGYTKELDDDLAAIAEAADSMVVEMDFSFLWNPRKKVLSVGYDVSAERLEASTYDLLASESRIASFVAIAKGDAPKDAWFHLGRKHTLINREAVLVSWTGTMFEYLMPAIWMIHHPGTLLWRSLHGAVRAQRRHMRNPSVPWGISESGCGDGCDGNSYGYAPFGIPELAMKMPQAEAFVVSPYSSFLALLADPAAAVRNIHRMTAMGWTGRYGLYEAVDYSQGDPRMVRSWMAHHLGMSLLSVANLLFDNVFQKYFHAEPYVLATELLLHERVPTATVVDVEEIGGHSAKRERAAA